MSGKRFCIPHLGRLCEQYRYDLKRAINDDEKIRDSIRIIGFRRIDDLGIRVHIFHRHCLPWCNTLIKLHPDNHTKYELWYHEMYLLKTHKSQVSFGRCVFGNANLNININECNFSNPSVIDELNYEYGIFLALTYKHRSELIIPTLLQRFAWHAHMTDHDHYRELSRQIFGTVLRYNEPSNVEYLKFATYRTSQLRAELLASVNNNIINVEELKCNNNTIQSKDKEKKSEPASHTPIVDGSTGVYNIYDPTNPWNYVNPLSPWHIEHPTVTSKGYSFGEYYDPGTADSDTFDGGFDSDSDGGCGD